MHFEILVEDQSGKKMLDILVKKLIDTRCHTYKINAYKGIGHIPKDINAAGNARNQTLLKKLPGLLRAYGKTYSDFPGAVIVVCDLDAKSLKAFRGELFSVLDACNPQPETRFCIAIEEGEAWLLGDIPAIKAAYPNAKDSILQQYANDAICGTWELLADAVYSGGAAALEKKGWKAVSYEKSCWAESIAPHMDIQRNKSPSFQYFVKKLRELAQLMNGKTDAGEMER
jgi:hypothetical protein